MGLNLSVGYLSDLAENDPEGAGEARANFDVLNQFLRSKGLPAHLEPENIEPFSCEMWGYGGLHYLRRIAAHLAEGRPLPSPGDKDAAKDPILNARLGEQAGRRGFLKSIFGRATSGREFEHLIQHSDAEGYYLPQDFAEVLVAEPARWRIPGGYVGSSPRLLAECEKLARALHLPLDLDLESEEVADAPESQGNSDVIWKRYGVESFTCLRLHAAAKRSVETGAALVFC